MSLYSTRGGDCATASQAILRGLAADGGLFVPSLFPQISLEKIGRLPDMRYIDRASHILRDFLEDYTLEEIQAAVEGAYGSGWDDPAVAPVKTLTAQNDTHVLELFHGPTLAFKDVALKLLPYLMGMAAVKNEETREIAIIVATSGDTGKAALEGFKDVKGTSCSVFYPLSGVSPVQELQMNTTGGENTHVLGLQGNFDDAQRGVKRMFADAAFREKLSALGKVPSSANSINFGRLVPQVVYYFSAYADLVRSRKIRLGQKVIFAVPTGNFGDILAGYYAWRMGLPIERLICASNRNNVLSDFFKTGIYSVHRSFFKTSSPSMDILVSSNLERLLYEYTGRNGALVKTWMEQLAECGSFSIGEERLIEIQKLFYGECADEFETAGEIRAVWDRTHYLMDTHTAVASNVLRKYRAATGDRTAAVILSTASPYKFSADVLGALKGDPRPEGKDFFACAAELESLTGVPVPRQVKELKELPLRHNHSCSRENMDEKLLELMK